MGIKGCDLLTIPLCKPHHDELHKTGTVEPYSAPEAEAECWKAVALCLRDRVLQNEPEEA